MARVAIPLNTLPFQGGSNALTTVASDGTNEHYFVNDGNTMLLIVNKDGALTANVSVISVDDPFGRSENVTLAVAPGATAQAGPFIPAIWNQGGGNQVNVDIDQTDADIVLAAVKFSPIR